MKDGPVIAAIAALIGDPARANMLTGLMDGRALTLAEVEKIADLESREVLLARVAGALKAKQAQAAALFAAPASQVARLAAALQEKKAAEGSAEPAA